MDIQNVKDWLDEAIEFFGDVVSKTGKYRDIQQNIESNRVLFDIPFRKREEIKAWVQTNKPTALSHLVQLKTWIEEWYQYFDAGYKPPDGETIDTLPGLILEKLKWLREKLDTL